MANRFAQALRGTMQESEERTENALLNNTPEKMTTISSYTEKAAEEKKQEEEAAKVAAKKAEELAKEAARKEEEAKKVEEAKKQAAAQKAEEEEKSKVENQANNANEADMDVDEAIRADWERYNEIYPDGTYYKGMQLNVPVEINQRYELLKARLDKPGKIKIVKKQLYLMALEEYLNNHEA